MRQVRFYPIRQNMPPERTPPSDIDTLLTALSRADRQTAVARLERTLDKLVRQRGTPIVRGSEAHFIVESECEETIRLIGDWGRWKPTDKLTRLHERSRFYHLKKYFPIDARLA